MSAKIIKIVLVGDGAVGKTSLVFAFTENPLKDSYEPTIVDVYDNVETKWVPELRKMGNIPIVLVGTKSDLRSDGTVLAHLKSLGNKSPITCEQGQSLAKKIKAQAYVESSSQTKQGIKDVFHKAAKLVIDKIVIIGEGGSGKTSILMGYKDKTFNPEWIPTVFDNYIIKVPVNDQEIPINLWDTAGQEAYEQLRTITYDGCKLFLICFDLANPDSLIHAEQKWAPEVRKFSTAPFFLVGNKTDLRDAFDLKGRASLRDPLPVTTKQGEGVARAIGAKKYMECSAMLNKGLNELFEKAAGEVIPKERREKKLCLTPCKISPPHLFGYPSSFNPSTMHLSTYQDPPSSPTRMTKAQILALLCCVALVHGKVIGTLKDPLMGTPDSVLERASQMVHEPRQSGSPLRFFMRTSYSTVTQTQIVTSTSTTFNTCYMTESGIIPCNKRRNIEVESKPRVFLQGQEKTWEDIIPTRLSRVEAASDDESVIELVSKGDPLFQTEEPLVEIVTVTLAGREDLSETTTQSGLEGRDDDSETTTYRSPSESKEDNVEASTFFTDVEPKEDPEASTLLPVSETREEKPLETTMTTTNIDLEGKGVEEVIQSVNHEVVSTVIESVSQGESDEGVEAPTESSNMVIAAEVKNDEHEAIEGSQEIFGVETVKVVHNDNSEEVLSVASVENESVTGTPKGDLIIIEGIEAVEAMTVDPNVETLEGREDEIALESSIQNHNWIEREIQGIQGDCFDPSNIALRFLTVVETKVAHRTTTVIEYETGAKVQTVRFAANADACLPTNLYPNEN
eukprot:TCALIF_10420-PA protein Name:"Similar to Rac1 Ras-related protein Rac1 (Drosophila melanogaster)" AED:0.15 eAED:0.16 QI:17/0.37/0.11/0.88/0.5/0.55/9/0/793